MKLNSDGWSRNYHRSGGLLLPATPQSTPTRLQLGMAYLAAGNLDTARQNLSMVVKATPDDYRAQLGMAQYEQRIGETAAVENRYRLALKPLPQNSEVMKNYGAFLCGLGQIYRRNSSFPRLRNRRITVRWPIGWRVTALFFQVKGRRTGAYLAYVRAEV